MDFSRPNKSMNDPFVEVVRESNGQEFLHGNSFLAAEGIRVWVELWMNPYNRGKVSQCAGKPVASEVYGADENS